MKNWIQLFFILPTLLTASRGTGIGTALGLTNDAHGYIILPEAWEHKTSESELSLGGENHGNWIAQKVIALLQPEKINE